jgi:hypothetical protein
MASYFIMTSVIPSARAPLRVCTQMAIGGAPRGSCPAAVWESPRVPHPTARAKHTVVPTHRMNGLCWTSDWLQTVDRFPSRWRGRSIAPRRKQRR